MRRSRRLLLAFLLTIVPAGCGAKATSSRKSVTAASTLAKGRKDMEPDYASRGYDYDDWAGLNAGTVATADQRNAIVGVVTRYYSAAATGDGAAACMSLAEQPSELGGASIGGSYGLGPRACARLLTRLLESEDRRFASRATHIRILKVLVEGGGEAATAFLEGGDGQLGSMQLQREGKTWRIVTPRGRQMP